RSEDKDEPTPSSLIGRFLANRRRALMVGVSALLLLYGAIQIVGMMSAERGAETLAPTSGQSQPAEPKKVAAPAATPAPAPVATAAATPQAGTDKLPASIGGPALRTAAASGNPAAEYEIAVRFAEGRGLPANLELAVQWFERAAQQGLAPAFYRLGSLYEKG